VRVAAVLIQEADRKVLIGAIAFLVWHKLAAAQTAVGLLLFRRCAEVFALGSAWKALERQRPADRTRTAAEHDAYSERYIMAIRTQMGPVHSWDLLWVLVSRDFKLRYRRSVLGVAWSLLNPLLQLLIFRFTFGTLLPLHIPDYTVFLFIGLLAWAWFQSSLLAATGAIVDNGSLIRQPGFPDSILPVVIIISNLTNFLFAFPILLLFLGAAGHGVTPALGALPIVICVQGLFTLSLAYLLASMHVFFRDTQYLVGVGLMLGFYLSPVFYASSYIPHQYQRIYRLNPVGHLIDAYRSVFIAGRYPDFAALAAIAAGSALMLAWTYFLFSRTRYRFIEEV